MFSINSDKNRSPSPPPPDDEASGGAENLAPSISGVRAAEGDEGMKTTPSLFNHWELTAINDQAPVIKCILGFIKNQPDPLVNVSGVLNGDLIFGTGMFTPPMLSIPNIEVAVEMPVLQTAEALNENRTIFKVLEKCTVGICTEDTLQLVETENTDSAAADLPPESLTFKINAIKKKDRLSSELEARIDSLNKKYIFTDSNNPSQKDDLNIRDNLLVFISSATNNLRELDSSKIQHDLDKLYGTWVVLPESRGIEIKFEDNGKKGPEGQRCFDLYYKGNEGSPFLSGGLNGQMNGHYLEFTDPPPSDNNPLSLGAQLLVQAVASNFFLFESNGIDYLLKRKDAELPAN